MILRLRRSRDTGGQRTPSKAHWGAVEAAPFNFRGRPEEVAWGEPLRTLAASFQSLGEMVLATPRGAIEILIVALDEPTSRWKLLGRSARDGLDEARPADKLEMIGHVRNALEAWE